MKGLLLKDWYMMKAYARSYLLIVAVFTAISLFSEQNLFFAFYPCILCGMLPVTLLSYDERCRWNTYSGTLPYTKAQIVSSKYIMGLIVQTAVITATGTVHAVRMVVCQTFLWQDLITFILLLSALSTLSCSFCMPFVFKFGVEKGRIAYYVMIGIACACSVISTALFKEELSVEIRPHLLLAALAVLSGGLYALSWYLSICFYKKREL